MLDLGWTELLVIGVVALIVVGPKDLPKMFRTLGQFTAKARNMAREFQRAMDEAADSSGVKDVARDFRKATNPQGMGLDELKNWDPMKDDSDSKTSKASTPSAAAKTDTSKDAAAQKAEDDAALDRIAAEMEALRRERAPKASPASDSAKVTTKATPKTAAKTNATPKTKTTTKSARTPARTASKPATKTAAKPAGTTGAAKPTTRAAKPKGGKAAAKAKSADAAVPSDQGRDAPQKG